MTVINTQLNVPKAAEKIANTWQLDTALQYICIVFDHVTAAGFMQLFTVYVHQSH